MRRIADTRLRVGGLRTRFCRPCEVLPPLRLGFGPVQTAIDKGEPVGGEESIGGESAGLVGERRSVSKATLGNRLFDLVSLRADWIETLGSFRQHPPTEERGVAREQREIESRAFHGPTFRSGGSNRYACAISSMY